MGQELLNQQGWIKKPRLYFKATNSKGIVVTRGSAHKRYAYCVISTDFNKWGGVYASWSSTEELANRYCRQANKNGSYEVVKAEVTTAKEVRVIKKQMTLDFIERQSVLTKDDKENN